MPTARLLTTLGILSLSMLLFGAMGPVARHGIVGITALAFVVMALTSLVPAGRRANPFARLSLTETALALTPPLYVGGQMLAHTALNHYAPAPPYAIWDSFALLTALSCFYLMVRVTVTNERACRAWIFGLLLLGAAEASYGLLNLLAGNEYLLTYRRWVPADSATGTFVSRNHFAYVLEMALPLAVASIALVSRERATGFGSQRLPSETTAKAGLVMTGVLMIALALLFSQSRSGMASVLVASALMLVVSSYLWRGKRRSYKASRIAMTIVAVAAGMVMAAIVGVDAVLLRFFDAPQSLEEGRLPIWGATIRMFLDSPILGHGWGSFPHLVSGYRPAPDGLAYSHAHNEYLEILADGGLVAIAIVGLMLALFARRLFSALASPLPGNRRRLIVGLAIAITSVLLHSVTDFGLRVPAVCLMFVAVVAIFVTLTEQAPGGATT